MSKKRTTYISFYLQPYGYEVTDPKPKEPKKKRDAKAD